MTATVTFADDDGAVVSMLNIENMTVRVSGANGDVDLIMGDVSGLETFTASRLGDDLNLIDMTTLDTNLVIANTATGAELFVEYEAGVADGDVDEVNLTVTRSSDADFHVHDVEIVNLTSTDAPSGDANVLELSGHELETVNVTANAALNLTVFHVTEVNVSGAGDVEVTLDELNSTVTTTGTGDLVVTALGDNDYTLTGGVGDDTFIMGDELDADDEIDGGNGDDTLVVSAASNGASIDDITESVTNVESLIVLSNGDNTLDVEFTNITDITLVSTATADSFVVEKVTTQSITLTDVVDDGTTSTGFASIDISLEDASGDEDSVTLNLTNADDEAALTITLIESSDSDNIETLTLNLIQGADVEDASDIVVTEIVAGDIGTETLIITGNADATLGDVGTEITQATVDASAATGDLTVFAGNEDQDISLGFGDDTLNMDDNLSDDDTLDGGAGDDILNIDLGSDTSDDLVVTGFETITFTDADSTSFDFTNVSGVTTVEIGELVTGALTLDELSAGVQVVITEDLAHDILINGATAGSSINVDYEVDNVAESTISFGNEYTTVNYDLSDEDEDYTVIKGNFLATASTLNINITGDDGIDFDTNFTAGVRRINVNSTVALVMDVSADTLNTGVEINLSGTEEDTELTVSATQIASGGFDLIGGDGDNDELSVDIATSTSAATISGFETLTIDDSDAGGTINMQNITGVETINIDGITTDALDVSNIADGQAVDITSGLNIITLSSDDADNSINITFANDFVGAGDELVVEDFATVNIDTGGVNQTGVILDLSTGVDTLVLTGEGNFVLDVASDTTGVGTFDLSGFEGDADFAALVMDDDADVILGADNGDVDFTLDTGGSNIITFASDLVGDVVINDFEFGFISDRIDLTALGVANSSQLTVVFDDGGDGTAGDGNESFTLTADLFDGSIVLVGNYAGSSALTSESIIFA